MNNSSINTKTLYVPPHLRSGFSPIQIVRVASFATENEIDKRISGTIKNKRTMSSVLSFCQHPKLDGNEVKLNEIHFTMLFSNIGKNFVNQILIPNSDSWLAVEEICQIMRSTLPSCSIGKSAQIIRTLGSLNYKDPDTEQWLLNQLITHMDKIQIF